MTSGFTHFRALMEEIVADLGGTSRAREAVGRHFDACLKLVTRPPARDPNHYGWLQWYECSDEDLRRAADHAYQNWRLPSNQEPTAEAPYLGGKIVVYETEAKIVTASGFHILAAMLREDVRFDRRLNKDACQYVVSLAQDVEVMLNLQYGGQKTNANTKSKASAYTSLRRIVESSFKVSLENIA